MSLLINEINRRELSKCITYAFNTCLLVIRGSLVVQLFFVARLLLALWLLLFVVLSEILTQEIENNNSAIT